MEDAKPSGDIEQVVVGEGLVDVSSTDAVGAEPAHHPGDGLVQGRRGPTAAEVGVVGMDAGGSARPGIDEGDATVGLLQRKGVDHAPSQGGKPPYAGSEKGGCDHGGQACHRDAVAGLGMVPCARRARWGGEAAVTRVSLWVADPGGRLPAPLHEGECVVSAEPRDRCPYHRPFADGFDDCPAYQLAQFIPMDMRYRPLEPVWTCGNLDIRSYPGASHRFYARCRVGDEQARRDLVEWLTQNRMQVIRGLQREIVEVGAPYARRMWELKGRQLRAVEGSQERHEVTAELRGVGLQYLGVLEAFLEKRAARFREINVSCAASMELFSYLIDRLITQPNVSVPEVPDSLLRRFPPEIRALINPEAA